MCVGMVPSRMPRNTGSDRGDSRRTFLRVAGAAGAVALAGCAGGGGGGSGDGDAETDASGGGSTETDAGGTATDAGSEGADITLGALYPLTGPYGGLAQLMRQGNNLAVAQINESGGINGSEVEIVGEDTQADPQTGNQKARKLVEDDDADVLFGAISSAVGAAVAGYAAEVNVPYYPVVAADQITGENCRRTTFRYTTRATQMATSGAPWAVDRFGTNFWIHNADYLWGNSVATAWEREARNAGEVNVVGNTTSQLGASDFSSYISEIAASDAEWVLTGLNGGDAVNFLKQAQSYGLKNNTTIVSPVNSFQFIRRAAGEAAIGTFASIRYFEGFDSEVNRQFVSDFTDMHGSAPDAFAHDGWTNVQMYALAAEQAGSTDTDAIIDAQPGIEFEAPMGSTRYRECDHQAVHPVSIGEIVEPADYEWPSMDVLQTVSSEDAILPCSDVGCEF